MPNDVSENLDEASAVDANSADAPAVSILIVGYNTKDLLIDCLAGLYEHTRNLKYEILYVDCSNDGSVQVVRDRFPSVRVIENDQNLGFGRGNNFLARHAKGEYLLLLNPDTLIYDNAIGTLYEFAQRTPGAGAWGGVTRLPTGTIDPGCQQPAPGLGSLLLLLLGLGKLALPTVESDDGMGIDVPSLSGAFMMMPRELWEQLGGFDESFFMYCEETDLCYRVRAAGRRVLITSSASIVHLVGSGSAQSAKRMLALTRGGMHLSRKHFGTWHVMTEAVLRWLYSLSRYALSLLGQPVIGSACAKELRARHAPIIANPGAWLGGWTNRAVAQNSSKGQSST